MAFQSGRVSFSRFRVQGDAPATADDTVLAILAEHAFRESDIGAPDEIESGWITGDHLFDTHFTYEKNGFGNMLLFALRIDTHKVPAEIKRAYKRMNEAAAQATRDNPTGFLSKREKQEASDETGRQLHEDLAAGKFRKSKAVPVMWDLTTNTVYCGASGNTIVEELAKRFKESFNLNLHPLTSGALAGEVARAEGRTRDWEDLRPSAFTPPPPQARNDHEDADRPQDVSVPVCPWAAVSTDLKDYLGNEFFIWLWWIFETAEGIVTTELGGREAEIALTIDKTLDMDCAWEVAGKQTLRGDGPTRLAEAGDALLGGKWPRKAGLILADVTGGEQYELTLQLDRMQVGSAALPEIPDASGPRELVEARLELVRQLSDILDALYGAFLKVRLSGSWPGTRDQIRDWIRERLQRA